MCEIGNSAYYERLIAPIRTIEFAEDMIWLVDGFKYEKPDASLSLQMKSKNNYWLTFTNNGKRVQEQFNNKRDAVNKAIYAIKMIYKTSQLA